MRAPRVLFNPPGHARLAYEGAGSVSMGWMCGTPPTANLLHKC